MVQPGKGYCDSWLNKWDAQQNAHIRGREDRFRAMFDFVSETVGNKPLILDLACGPGSLSKRLLKRFSEARSVAVDYDPVLLHLGRCSLGDMGGRLRWVEANLTHANWFEKLPETEYDAVLSTTALHWIAPSDLKTLYRDIWKSLRLGGVFINGDYMVPEDESELIKSKVRNLEEKIEEEAFASSDAMYWSKWWEELRKDKGLESLFLERDRRYPSADDHDKTVTLGTHIEFLKVAGFRDIGVIWQDLENRVLVAVK